MRSTLTVTAKGQVTLRRELLDHLGVQPGDKIVVELLPSGRAAVSAAKAGGSIEDFIGCVGSRGIEPPSIDAMNEIIAAGWAGKP